MQPIFFILSFAFLSAGKAVSLTPELSPPKQQIAQWIRESLSAKEIDANVIMMDNQQWQDYLNYEHFLPLTLDGFPEGFQFDFTSSGHKTMNNVSPLGEVDENGSFRFWLGYCAWERLGRRWCHSGVESNIEHETMHFNQWRMLAAEAIFQVSGVKPAVRPNRAEDLRAYPGAWELLQKKWKDSTHYQCREVQVYAAQYGSDERGPGDLRPHLEGYLSGCGASAWAAGFRQEITVLERFLLRK